MSILGSSRKRVRTQRIKANPLKVVNRWGVNLTLKPGTVLYKCVDIDCDICKNNPKNCLRRRRIISNPKKAVATSNP